MSKHIHPSNPVHVPLSKVPTSKYQGGSAIQHQKQTTKERTPRHLTDPRRLDTSCIQHGREGSEKPLFSVSAAKVDNKNVLYLGVHGDVVKLYLSEADLDTLMDVLEALSQC